jgi:hypothetical protein
MDFINIYSKKNAQKYEEEMVKNQKEIEKKQKERADDKIERERVKIIQPLDIDKMEEYKNRTILFISQCKKKQYIYDYFQRMSSNVFYSKNNCRPYLIELGRIILETIPKHEEQEFLVLMSNFEYGHKQNIELLAMTRSLIIIDTLYDFCKSVDAEIENIVV